MDSPVAVAPPSSSSFRHATLPNNFRAMNRPPAARSRYARHLVGGSANGGSSAREYLYYPQVGIIAEHKSGKIRVCINLSVLLFEQTISWRQKVSRLEQKNQIPPY